MSQANKIRSFVSWIALAGLIVAGVLIWNNRTALADDFRLFRYTPPANVAALADKIGFTSEGQRYFYASHPEIEDRSAFNAACGNTEVHAMVLGCYADKSIYVYNVTDSRLDGVQEVTAAHETLHAAYDRLSLSERSHVNTMLQRQYDTMITNEDFSKRFSVYNSLSQADKLNELHSIFGTEITPLSSELESYYQQYFKNRSTITSFHATYQGQFDMLTRRQAELKAQIADLKTGIDAKVAQYERDRSALNDDIQTFNAKASGGGYASQSQFASDRAALAARAQTMNMTASDINATIDRYNTTIQQYNDLGVQTKDLQNSLDSKSVQAAPTV